jgi:O-antigen/teichoic acid export membrane protein
VTSRSRRRRYIQVGAIAMAINVSAAIIMYWASPLLIIPIFGPPMQPLEPTHTEYKQEADIL